MKVTVQEACNNFCRFLTHPNSLLMQIMKGRITSTMQLLKTDVTSVKEIWDQIPLLWNVTATHLEVEIVFLVDNMCHLLFQLLQQIAEAIQILFELSIAYQTGQQGNFLQYAYFFVKPIDLAVFAGITPFDNFMTLDSVSVILKHLEKDNTWGFYFLFLQPKSFSFLVQNHHHHCLQHQHYWVFASSVLYYHLSLLFHSSYTLRVLGKRVNYQDNVGNQSSTSVQLPSYSQPLSTSCNSIYDGD